MFAKSKVLGVYQFHHAPMFIINLCLFYFFLILQNRISQLHKYYNEYFFIFQTFLLWATIVASKNAFACSQASSITGFVFNLQIPKRAIVFSLLIYYIYPNI